MRERIAVTISVLATALLAALSLLFASAQTRAAQEFATPVQAAPEAGVPPHAELPADPQPIQDATQATPSDSARGRAIFVAQGCERCHSVEGRGSPRFPLDGVGSRRALEALYDWTVATPAVQDSLSASAVRAKRRYEQVPEADMQALLRYLIRLVERPQQGR